MSKFSCDFSATILNVLNGGHMQMLVYEFMAGGTLRDHLIRTSLLTCFKQLALS